MSAQVRFAAGPARDGSRGFNRRRQLWAAFYDRKTIIGYPGAPIAAPTTYAAARAAAVAFLRSQEGNDLVFVAHTDRHGAGTKVDDLEAAFPAVEVATSEYHGVSITKGGAYKHRVYLYPLTSYLWANTRRFWEPEEEEERDNYDDRYDEESRGGYEEEEEEPWQRNCTCDASGPYFCSCSRSED